MGGKHRRTFGLPLKSSRSSVRCRGSLPCMTRTNLVRLVSNLGKSQSMSQMNDESTADCRLVRSRISSSLTSSPVRGKPKHQVFLTVPVGYLIFGTVDDIELSCCWAGGECGVGAGQLNFIVGI